MDEDRIQRLLQQLRHAGLRLTTPRRVIVETLVTAGGHVTADDLANRIHEAHPAVHRATVYRVLDTFERLGLVEHVHLGHGRAVYHLADDIHQHLYCESCGAVMEAPPRLLFGVERRLRERYDFTMRPYHFALVGTCENCSNEGDSGSQ